MNDVRGLIRAAAAPSTERHPGIGGELLALAASLAGHAAVAALLLTQAAVLVDAGDTIMVEIVGAIPGAGQAARALDEIATRAAASTPIETVQSVAAPETAADPPAPTEKSRDRKPMEIASTAAAIPTTPALPQATHVPDDAAATAKTAAVDPPARIEAAEAAVGAAFALPPSAESIPRGIAVMTSDGVVKEAPQTETTSPTTSTGDGEYSGSDPTPMGGNSRPAYPPRAVRGGMEGRVLLTVEVLPSGEVAHVGVKQTSGHPILDRAALDAVRRWRFNPALRVGVPVRAEVLVPVAFRLTE